MYNGIGLSSARGTATSGYVQRSKGHVNRERQRRTMARNAADGPPRSHNIISAAARERGNIDLQQHERKRQLENQLLIMREEMEEEGIVDEDIDHFIDKHRQETYEAWKQEELAQRLSSDFQSIENSIRPPEETATGRESLNRNCFNCGDPGHLARSCPHPRRHGPRHRTTHTHLLDAAHKKDENKKLANALGIQQESHTEGAAFDRELIEQKREQRRKEREKQARVDEKEKKKRERLENKMTKTKKVRRRRSPSASSCGDSSSSSSSSSNSASSSSMSSSSGNSGYRRRRHRSYSSSSGSSSSRSHSRSRYRKRSQDSSSSSLSSYSFSSNDSRRRPSDRRSGRSERSSQSGSPGNNRSMEDMTNRRSSDVDKYNSSTLRVKKRPEDSVSDERTNVSKVDGKMESHARSLSPADDAKRSRQSSDDVHHFSDAQRRESRPERSRSCSRSAHSSNSESGTSRSFGSSRSGSSSQHRLRKTKDHPPSKKRDRASRRASSTPSGSSESSHSSTSRRRKRRGRAH